MWGKSTVLAALALTLAAPAFAIPPSPGPAVTLADAWRLGGCDPAYEDSPLNGVDSVVRTSPGATVVYVVWSAQFSFNGFIVITAVDDDCQDVGQPVVLKYSGSAIVVPAAARWIVIEPQGMVNPRVTFH